jgi:hypothetical protein
MARSRGGGRLSQRWKRCATPSPRGLWRGWGRGLARRGAAESLEGWGRGIPPYRNVRDRMGHPRVVWCRLNGRFPFRLRSGQALTGLSARFGMTRFRGEAGYRSAVSAAPPQIRGACGAVEVVAFPVVALPNPKRDGAVESHPSASLRAGFFATCAKDGQPRSVVVSA